MLRLGRMQTAGFGGMLGCFGEVFLGINQGNSASVAKIAGILRHRYFLPSVILFGIALRLALLVAARNNSVFPDELAYEDIGTALWKTHQFTHKGFPTAFRAPGEPLFIAGVFALFGKHLIIIKLFQILSLGAVPYLCAKLGRATGLSVSAANVAAMLASFHPALAYASTTLYPTAFTTVALTAGVVYSVSAEKYGRASSAMKAGIAYGIAGLFTTTFVPVALLVSLICVLRRKLKIAVIILVVGLLPAAVWALRNRAVLGVTTLATNGGVNLYLGANDQATPLSGNWIKTDADPNADPRLSGDLHQDNDARERAVAWIKLHPGRYVWLSLQRAVLVADSVGNPKTEGMHSGVLARCVGWLMLPVVLLGFLGLFLYRGHPASWFASAALLLVVGSSAMTIVKPRFRLPCDPLLGTFAVLSMSPTRKKQLPLPLDTAKMTQ